MGTFSKHYRNHNWSQSAQIIITAVVWLAGALVLLPSVAAAVVVQPGPCSNIQKAINELASAGGAVVLSSGVYTCTAPIVINRNNVSLRGEGPGTVVRLAAHVNAPLVIVGQPNNEPTAIRNNIHISDLVLDGNRANQDHECWKNDCAKVRNNCISIRHANNVIIERVTTRRARSGGVVVEKDCRRVTIRDL